MKFASIFILAHSLAWAHSGGEVGNGGDTILCDNGTRVMRYFVLDYLVGQTMETPGQQIIASIDYRETEKQIALQLDRLNPALARQLREFSRFNGKVNNFNDARVWIPRSGLPDLDDEVVTESLPDECYDPATRKPRIFQAVIRQRGRGHQFIYSYSTIATSSFALAPGQTQMSFLNVHEWLWDYTKDVKKVRRMNFLLHSTWLQNVSAEEFNRTWREIGLSERPEIESID